ASAHTEKATRRWPLLNTGPQPLNRQLSAELVHGVVFTTGLQSGFTSKVFLVVVADVGAGHALVLDAGDTLTDLLTLNAFHVGQHAFLCEVAFCQVVGGQRGSVVSRQSDQVVEAAGFAGRVLLEGADALVGFVAQLGSVVLYAYQVVAVVGGSGLALDRKSTRLNSSHVKISYAVFCL